MQFEIGFGLIYKYLLSRVSQIKGWGILYMSHNSGEI